MEAMAMRRGLIGGLFVLALLAAAPAWAYEYSDCGGTDCRWDGMPIRYYVRDPLGVDLDEDRALAEIRASFDRWDHRHQTLCEPLSFDYQGRFESNEGSEQNLKNVVYFETGYWPFGGEALAVTLLWYDQDGFLREADIAFNAGDYLWTTETADPANNVYGVRQTLTHEAGHVWGLDHSADKYATMYAYYKSNIAPEDLDYDDIAGAADRYCGELPPADDLDEPNDSYAYFGELDGVTTLDNRRLYDDDWYRLTLAEGMRLKLTVTDESPKRYKSLELRDLDGNLVDQQRCDGDCAQALGDAGAERRVALVIRGDFDEHQVETTRYTIRLKQVLPGDEGPLTDDDGGDDDDDSGRGCLCHAGPPAGKPVGDWLFLWVVILLAALFIRRRVV
jgi:MYXO-CTERM domain-containing protein